LDKILALRGFATIHLTRFNSRLDSRGLHARLNYSHKACANYCTGIHTVDRVICIDGWMSLMSKNGGVPEKKVGGLHYYSTVTVATYTRRMA
jgi:hypothetical protein